MSLLRCYRHRRNPLWITFASTAFFLTTVGARASAETIRVTVENFGISGNTFITPVFAGFHDGSFDLFNTGSPASIDLERLAEDGNNGPLESTFAMGGRVGGTIGMAPLGPGAIASRDFTITMGGAGSRLLLATMLLPTNDFFLGNNDPNGLDISALASGPISFTLNRIYDAGTEVNDFSTAAGNGLLPGTGLPPMQSGPNVGTIENGNVTFVGTIQADGTVIGPDGITTIDPFASFAGVPPGFNPGFSLLRVTVAAIPEPSTALFCGAGVAGWWLRRRRQRRDGDSVPV